MSGAPCWIEIPARDLPSLKKFYAAAFPEWQWRPATADHPAEHVASFSFKGANSEDISGGIIAMPECPPHSQTLGAGFTVYFMVDSIEKQTEHIHGLGGKTVLAKKAEAGNGWFSNLTDPEGNRFGLYEVNPDSPWVKAQIEKKQKESSAS